MKNGVDGCRGFGFATSRWTPPTQKHCNAQLRFPSWPHPPHRWIWPSAYLTRVTECSDARTADARGPKRIRPYLVNLGNSY